MNSNYLFAIGEILHLTKRELFASLRSRRFWTSLPFVVAILTVSAPFGTSTELNIAQRLVYWSSLSICAYLLAVLFGTPACIWAYRRRWDWPLSALVSGLAAAPPVAIFVFVVNTQVAEIKSDSAFSSLLAVCAIVTISGAFIQYLHVQRTRPRPSSAAILTSPSDTRFVERLSPDIRGELLSLQAQDHYIEVVTENGKELILMRLADAAEELSAIDGRRVHRSWWVARDAVDRFEKEGAKASLILKDGRVLPVSRSKQAEIRTWVS